MGSDNAHLLVDVVHVRLGRVRRDVQLVGDELGVAPCRQVGVPKPPEDLSG